MENLKNVVMHMQKVKLFTFVIMSCMLYEISASEVNANDGLILHYTFEEDFGGIAWDKSANGNYGELKGNAKRVKGNWGNALELEGKISYLDMPSKSFDNIIDQVTFSAWIKPLKKQTATIVQVSNLNRIMLVAEQEEDYIQASFGLEGKRFAINKTMDYSNKWIHVASCYDRGKITFYINGKKIQELFVPGNMRKKFLLKWPYTIGSEGGSGCFYGGLVDEIRIYSRGLCQEEISALASQKSNDDNEQGGYESKCDILRVNVDMLQRKLSDVPNAIFAKQVAALEKLNRNMSVAKESVDLGQSNWAFDVYPAFLDDWVHINREIEQVKANMEKENEQRSSSISERLLKLKNKIDVLHKEKINAKAIDALCGKAEMYSELNCLEYADEFKKKEFLEKSISFLEEGERLCENCDKPNVALLKTGEFFPGVTLSLMNGGALQFSVLKSLRISFIGNNIINPERLARVRAGILSWDFKRTDEVFLKNKEYGFNSMILVADGVNTLSRFYCGRNGFENELVEGIVSGTTGKWLIPAAPKDIPLKWISEHYMNIENFAKRYGNESGVMHWDIGGEAHALLDFYANSIVVQNAFRKYLSKKYGTINELNAIWQERYASFESIPVKRIPSNKWAMYEWYIFRNKICCNYLAYMLEPFKKYSPSIPVSPVICMNIMYPSNLDPYMLAEAGGIHLEAALDDYAARRDRYPHQILAAVVDVGRSISENGKVWIGELGYSISCNAPQSDCVRPHEVREWYYTAFIHGAKGVAAYYWSSGSNSFALMYPDFIPTESALKISELAIEARTFKNIWACTADIQVAVYYPRLSRFLYTESPIAQRLEMMGLWAIMSNCGFMIDPIDSTMLMKRLDRYKILVIPPSPYMSIEEQDRISAFMKKGGVVITSGLMGEFDDKGRKAQTSFRASIENAQNKGEALSKYFTASVSSDDGILLVVPKDIGRIYRDDWNSTEAIVDPVPPKFNREASVQVRRGLLAFLKGKGFAPYSCADTDEVETAIIQSPGEKYLVLINHDSKAVDAKISLNMDIGNIDLVEAFTLRRYAVKDGMMSVRIDANEVLFLKIK